MYVKDITDPELSKLLAYHATCPVAELKEKSLRLTAVDSSEKEIAVGSCYFDCDGLTDVLKDNYVSFAYTTKGDSPQTVELMPLPAVKLSDLMDVIFVSAIPWVGPITSGADGIDEGTIIVVPGYPESNLQESGNTQAEGAEYLMVEEAAQPPPPGENSNDNDGGNVQASQGSGSCGANIAVETPSGGGCDLWMSC
jgi:hypothetical protein